MDIIAILGAILAFSAILFGHSLEGGQFSSLVNLPALLIVVGGTLGATILQTPWARIMRAMQLVRWVLIPHMFDTASEVEHLTAWSKKARREGLLGLENIADQTTDTFRRRGLELLVDGVEPHTIRRLLDVASHARVDADLAAAQVFKSMGGYAPTIGILGAVIGLIQVMGNLANPDELGHGIATAFVATIYGLGFANLLLLPIADRIRSLVLRTANVDDMYIEGLIAIAEGEHPKSIEVRLRGLIAAA
ncbi:MAG: flagellar motor protein [Gammaproteobacteria bacterium]|nr:flagellar motor protein [Gammaproteobacteria bacterium]